MKDMTIQMERPYRAAGGTPAAGGAGNRRAVAGTGPRSAPRLRPRVPQRRRPASGMTPVRRRAPMARQRACGRTRAAGYRLGRWARLTITMSVLAVGLMFATGALPAGSTTVGPATEQIVVHGGDSLQSVAEAHSVDRAATSSTASSGQDVLAMMQRIRHLNGLEGLAPHAVLPTGLVLLVPSAG